VEKDLREPETQIDLFPTAFFLLFLPTGNLYDMVNASLLYIDTEQVNETIDCRFRSSPLSMPWRASLVLHIDLPCFFPISLRDVLLRHPPVPFNLSLFLRHLPYLGRPPSTR
jgi:hypothetical protein